MRPEVGLAGPGREPERRRAALRVEPEGDGERFQQGGLAGPVLPDQERDARVEREAAVRAAQVIGISVSSIKDVTPIPHNGCRPKKARRV